MARCLILIVAYVIHFLPAGLQSLEPALQQITPNLEEVARTLGLGVRDTWRRRDAAARPERIYRGLGLDISSDQ